MNLTLDERASLLEAAAAEARDWARRRAGTPQGEALAQEAEALSVQAAIARGKGLRSSLPEAVVERPPRRLDKPRRL
ncbi:hypothetical protein [Frateuria sp. Soil773]|uniref:hypothetical protein n=1 Tax=Frateuria sp. Soil773 TaxID=1736407 RepID=UPI0012F9999E|nr:hypothetical protein [Frateuria sp. Soil773]